jgi:hypothetical protein
MKRLLSVAVSVLVVLGASSAYAGDYLYVHNNDGTTIRAPGEDLVQFQIYSISPRSRVDITCAAGGGSGPQFINNSDGWKQFACSGGQAIIVFKEGGGKAGKDSKGVEIPADSDVVLRTGSGVYLTNDHGNDDYAKGRKCNVCGKILTW